MDSKFMTRAKSAFHNAAAKAERVLTDMKADIVAEFSSHGSAELPWVASNDRQRVLEDECRRQILDISKNPNFLHDEHEAGVYVDMHSANATLEFDENLRALRFKYVPKRMKEKEFWRRYFAAVKNVKQNIYELEPVAVESKPDGDAENPQQDPLEEEAYRKAVTIAAVPPSMLLRRLASAIQPFDTMKNLAASGVQDTDSSQVTDWPSLVSGLRKFSVRDKERKSKSQQNDQSKKYHSFLWSLFDADTHKLQYSMARKPTLPEELHGAPPDSFVAQLAEIIAGLKSEQKMAEFWSQIVEELRRRWKYGEPIPRVPLDDTPDLRYCLLHQKLQVVNCCISRRERRAAAVESLNILQARQSRGPEDNADCSLFARLKDGSFAPRLGVEEVTSHVNMLETGEPVYSPLTQEGPVLTEELIKENEELVLRTGSFGAGCSQLFSDMQAFKAANPGCILEDFVRWYSPPDWKESNHPIEKDEECSRGHLSTRMRCEGNLWQELWFSARPVPAVVQAPLFDEELAGESILNSLEDISPADLFEQLYIAALSGGFAIAEAAPSAMKDPLATYLKECKDYILLSFHRHMNAETLEDLCQIYELMEAAIHTSPEELTMFPRTLQTQTKLMQQQEKSGSNSNDHGPVTSVVKFFESKFDRRTKQGGKNPPKIVPAAAAAAVEITD